jgi:hypothetical protein
MTISGPDFRQTWLWRQAFQTPRSDSIIEEQEFFRTQYLSIRERAAQLWNPQATVELHFNAANRRAQGTETLWAIDGTSWRWAKALQDSTTELYGRFGGQDRGLKDRTKGGRGFLSLSRTHPSSPHRPRAGPAAVALIQPLRTRLHIIVHIRTISVTLWTSSVPRAALRCNRKPSVRRRLSEL